MSKIQIEIIDLNNLVDKMKNQLEELISRVARNRISELQDELYNIYIKQKKMEKRLKISEPNMKKIKISEQITIYT